MSENTRALIAYIVNSDNKYDCIIKTMELVISIIKNNEDIEEIKKYVEARL